MGVEGPEGVDLACPKCGADLELEPGRSRLVCTHCAHERPIEAEAVAPFEYDLDEQLHELGSSAAFVREGKQVECSDCGAKMVLSGLATRCTFCDSPLVIAPDTDEMVVPDRVLPFELGRREAERIYARWIGRRWFAPNDLKRRARAGRIEGVYVPYWAYSASAFARYAGLRGTFEYEWQDIEDVEGNRRRRKIKKTRWSPTVGATETDFENVLVAASTSVPSRLSERVEPWPIEALLEFDPELLSGFGAELYTVDYREGFSRFSARVEPEVRHTVKERIGGDAQRIVSLRIRYEDARFSHFLLPLWISSFRYRGRPYRFCLNGHSGKICGERPYSAYKIGLTVLAVLLVGLIIWWWQQHGG